MKARALLLMTALAALAAAALTTGCTSEAVVYEPVAPSMLHDVVQSPSTKGPVRTDSGEDRMADQFSRLRATLPTTAPLPPAFDPHEVEAAYAPNAPQRSYLLYLGGLRPTCGPKAPDATAAPAPCPLDRPDIHWELSSVIREFDGERTAIGVGLIGATGGLVAANIVCFGTDACGKGGKITVGVLDGVAVASAIVVTAVAFYVIKSLFP